MKRSENLDLAYLMNTYLETYGTPQSIAEKRYDLKKFKYFLAGQDGVHSPPRLGDWTPRLTAMFREYELERGMGPATVTRSIMTLKHFGKIVSQKLGVENPAVDVKPPRIPEIPPVEFKAEKLERCREGIKRARRCAFTNERNLLIFDIQLALGCRISEVLQWRVEQINFETWKVSNIKCKGGKHRNLYIPHYLRNRLIGYLAWRGDYMPHKSGPVWISIYREPRKMSYEALQDVYHAVGFHSHGLRHTRLRSLAKDDVRLAQRAAGHSDIKTTMRYVTCGDDEVHAALDAKQL